MADRRFAGGGGAESRLYLAGAAVG